MAQGSKLRKATMATLAAVAALLLVATVFALWDRSAMHLDDPDHPGRLWRALLFFTHHKLFYPVVGIALAGVAASVALVFVMRAGRRWPYLVTGIGAALGVLAAWLFRQAVWHVEAHSGSAKWAARSPYVHAATTAAVAVTVVLAGLAVLSLVTFFATRPARAS